MGRTSAGMATAAQGGGHRHSELYRCCFQLLHLSSQRERYRLHLDLRLRQQSCGIREGRYARVRAALF